ncbi:hypothetical protein NQ317_003494 [Molorchus minor]|uniref:Uncharacterized protein n=1 Tax=Molorchus minor TaxID=1323400 RepID=A0ABQ9J1G2_9CUCU|nr:hypothetical protein NQ317_003494 [Molorchus minor]
MMMVKTYLDGSSFAEFTNALKIYRDTENFDNFLELLDKVFVNKPNLMYLIAGLEYYIKARDKDKFNTYWERMKLNM